MSKIFLIIGIAVILSSCGVLPGGGRLYSDFNNVENYSAIGANRIKVRYDFGKPDVINEGNGVMEQWIYYNRQEGKTFTFVFDPQGMLISTNISDPGV